MSRPRTVTLVGLALVVGAFVALIAISLTSALVYYVTPTELSSQPLDRPVRLYGIVVAGSAKAADASGAITFQVTDGATMIAVESSAIPTALFRDGVGVVLAGRMTAPGRFQADEILVKHSAVYAPLRPGETLAPGILDRILGRSPSP
jgi:cytochrome c-type biogenesis protein CcmE